MRQFKRLVPAFCIAILLYDVAYSETENLNATADLNAVMQSAKDFARAQSGILNSQSQTTQPADMPGYSGNSSAEQYYGSGMNIENQAREAAATNSFAQDAIQALTSRPPLIIDPNTDPLFKRYDAIRTLANTLPDGGYTGCVDLPVGNDDVTTISERTCSIRGWQDRIDYACRRDLTVSCEAGTVPLPPSGAAPLLTPNDYVITGGYGMVSRPTLSGTTYSIPSVRRDYGGCQTFTNDVTFTLLDVQDVAEFVLTWTQYDDSLELEVNGNLVYSGRMGMNEPIRCEYGNYVTTGLNINVVPYLVSGTNVIRIRNRIGGGGGVGLQWRATARTVCPEIDNYSTVCPTGENVNGNFISSTCISGPATQTVLGYPIYRDCWAWSDAYYRLTEPRFEEELLCQQIRDDGCGQIGTTCLIDNGAYCELGEQRFQCSTTSSARTVSLCGEQLSCPDGNCIAEEKVYDQTATNFLYAETNMSMAAEIAKAGVASMNPGGTAFFIFTGNSKECDKGDFGTFNCCQDNGWANGSFVQCTADEMTLGLAREASQTHYVGEYCSSRVTVLTASWCVKTSEVYCLYPSKLARIFMEQANAQLGRGYGTPESPICSGLDQAQFELLDMTIMDFSEFGSDVQQSLNAAGAPGTSILIDRVNQTFQNMQATP